MSPPSIASLIQVGLDVLKTYVSEKTKSVLAQVGDVVGETVDADEVEWWQHVCFISRPPKPAPGKAACQAVLIRRGGISSVIASRDLRGQELSGQIGDGEFCLYAPGADGNSQGRIIGKTDGSINLYTREGNSKDGGGIVIQVDAANDAIRLLNSKGYGIIIDSDGVRVTSGGAGVTLTDGGNIKIIGTGTAQMDGTSITLGALAVPGVNNAITGPAGIAGIASTKVFIATA